MTWDDEYPPSCCRRHSAQTPTNKTRQRCEDDHSDTRKFQLVVQSAQPKRKVLRAKANFRFGAIEAAPNRPAIVSLFGKSQRFSKTAIISLNVDFFEQFNFENFESCLSNPDPAASSINVKAMTTMSFGYPTTTSPAAAAEPDPAKLATLMETSQSSVLDTPPVFDAATTPAFPNYFDALSSMESGLFNDIPAVFNPILESAMVISSAFDTGPRPATTGFVPPPLQSSAASAPVEIAAPPVQFDYHQDMLMDAKPDIVLDHDPPMPIIRTLSHDHPYVNSENEDYQILRDFLSLGHDLGVVPDPDDDELNTLVGTLDVGQLGRSTSYMDTYGDLTSLLSHVPNAAEQQFQIESMDQVPLQDQESMQDLLSHQTQPEYDDDEPSVSQYTYDSTMGPYSYPSSPEPAPSPFQPSTAPKPKSGGRKANRQSPASGVLVKDDKYWERRQKNNVASARSRQTRKQRAVETDLERQQLEVINRHLKEELAKLSRQVEEHKRNFFSVFRK